MSKLPFREFHLYALMRMYDCQELPLDLVMRDYFHSHRALGAKDRAYIGDAAYTLVRWQRLLSASTRRNADWQAMHELLQSTSIPQLQENPQLSADQRYSCPPPLFDALVRSYGDEKACELCRNFNERAPLTIRVNTLKISRSTLMDRWRDTHALSATEHSPHGITFHEKVNLFGTKEFKEGLFELQDEGSQLLADLVDVKPGEHVLDYCAGGGGKALAIGPKLELKGQIYLHDIRTHALSEARKRLRRAGIQNSQIVHPDTKALKLLKKKMDWVLVDAPCSGTGTLRRNPDMKWQFNESTLPQLVGLQRQIFERALSYVRPGGYIVYATCSVLNEENEGQVAHFCNTYSLELVGSPLKILPSPRGMDGFFGVVFHVQKKHNEL